MRKADIITASIILAWCVYSMIDAKLNLVIGWVPDVGPGAGFLPFWLCAIMGLFTAIVLVQAIRSEDTGEAFFVSDEGRTNSMKVLVSTTGCVVAYALVGCYIGSALYIGFYMKAIGKRKWLQTVLVGLGIPIGIYLMFEWFLKISLPKGLPIVEDIWYALMPDWLI